MSGGWFWTIFGVLHLALFIAMGSDDAIPFVGMWGCFIMSKIERQS